MRKFSMPPLINSSCTKKIILGTAPGDHSLQKQQYYGNNGNHFWKIIAHFSKQDSFLEYDEKVRTILNHKVALWDVYDSVEREGSSDMNIKNGVLNNFEEFYKNYPNIKEIYFSSIEASKVFFKNFKKDNAYSYYILPSPSRLNRKSLQQKIEEWKILFEK